MLEYGLEGRGGGGGWGVGEKQKSSLETSFIFFIVDIRIFLLSEKLMDWWPFKYNRKQAGRQSRKHAS